MHHWLNIKWIKYAIKGVLKLTAHNSVASFGGVYFKIGNVPVRRKSSTLKTNIGKKFIEKDIPLRNVLDRTLSVTGLIDGLSQTAAQTKAQAIEVDRAALEALEDGYHHVYNDGRHSGNFAIVPETLIFPDSADVTQGEPMRFTMELVEWQ